MNYSISLVFVALALSVGAQDEDEGLPLPPPSELVPEELEPSPVLETVQSYVTSQGQVAAGLEVVNGNLATLSNQVNDYAQIADEELDAALMMTTQATSILVNSQVIELQEQLRQTQTLIDEIRARINQSTEVCQTFLDCDDCTRDSACVWCRAEKSCVAGDRNGPLGGECLAYSYNTCGGGCGEHSQCAACVGDSRCGWCRNGGVCMQSDGHDCDESLWLVQSSTAGNDCPGAPGATTSYQSFNPNAYIDTQLSRLQRDLRENMDRAASLREQIDTMQGELTEVVERLGEESLGDIEDIETTNSLLGLAAIIDETAQRDQDELLARTREIAQEVGEQVSADTVAAVEASNQERIQQEEQFMETIRSMTETMAEQNAAQQAEMANQQRINEELATQTAQMEQQNQAAEAQADAASSAQSEAPASESSSFLQESTLYLSPLPLKSPQ